jgi:hypothetical protein
MVKQSGTNIKIKHGVKAGRSPQITPDQTVSKEAASSWRDRSRVQEKVSSDLENKIAKAVEQEGGRRTLRADERK